MSESVRARASGEMHPVGHFVFVQSDATEYIDGHDIARHRDPLPREQSFDDHIEVVVGCFLAIRDREMRGDRHRLGVVGNDTSEYRSALDQGGERAVMSRRDDQLTAPVDEGRVPVGDRVHVGRRAPGDLPFAGEVVGRMRSQHPRLGREQCPRVDLVQPGRTGDE